MLQVHASCNLVLSIYNQKNVSDSTHLALYYLKNFTESLLFVHYCKGCERSEL